ncbi:uncharacterized protein N0V89_003696 [Didymosphaeria variabile]|uniref:GST C-terminal domain-containing protein n=1 Tax=Didymosphaeria variabile TaxID=1932322 RepID=A0A9W9CCY6_9PLEO|nr:uncharacterized protein N0V89_003696 [Didymosphaeria variabile]KAJ4355676.1 hypothetical protein N0V89_003696 [Didymosphaeria variabile]
MPFPRRIAGYLSEKRIPQSAITIVHVTDPQKGDHVVPSQASKFPPRPKGSLPILAIPPSDGKDWTYIRQSMAIIYYLEEACSSGGQLAHLNARAMIKGDDALERARIAEILTLAEELLVSWNPVRSFGTGAGTLKYPEGAKEMLRWVMRTIATVDKLLVDRGLDYLRNDTKSVSIADVVLFHFLDFVEYCYGVDLTKGSGAVVKDVYGRDSQEEYPRLEEFYRNFKVRESAKRHADRGELAASDVLKVMQSWHDGVL